MEIKEIKCQNCEHKLAEKLEDGIKYDPSKIESITQALDGDSILITLQCPVCGCMLQIKA